LGVPEPNERRGVLLLLCAALGFSAMSVLVKLGGYVLPVAMLVLARGAVSLVLSVALVRRSGVSLWGNQPWRLVGRGLLGLGGLACFFYAVTALPLAEVTVLHYMNPVFTAVIAAVWLGEKVDRRLVLAISLALAGTLLVVRPGALFGSHVALSPSGVLAALGGAIFSAFAYTTVRSLSRTEHPDVIVFYFSLMATPATLPFAIAVWKTPDWRGWLLLLGIGVTTQISQVFLTRGLAVVPAARGTTVGYIQIVFASMWGWLLFHETPTVWTFAGAVLVILSTLLILGRSATIDPRGSSGSRPA
jgi:drug/metabolite transporter (DMT)-like permease